MDIVMWLMAIGLTILMVGTWIYFGGVFVAWLLGPALEGGRGLARSAKKAAHHPKASSEARP
jgi:hypothetical protein